jgi:hypothetical protein
LKVQTKRGSIVSIPDPGHRGPIPRQIIADPGPVDDDDDRSPFWKIVEMSAIMSILGVFGAGYKVAKAKFDEAKADMDLITICCVRLRTARSSVLIWLLIWTMI